MKSRGRKRYFSLIFVPDQEQDPKSLSMSYAKGQILLVLLVALMLHVVWGGVGYYRIFRLKKERSALWDENKELKAQNKQIERIAKEFQEIRRTDEKIRKAFGGSLGFEEQSTVDLNAKKLQSISSALSSRVADYQSIPMDASTGQVQNNLNFLTEKSGEYFNPEYLPTLLPVEGFLTTRFQKGNWYVGRSHLGIDIATKQGTPIRAAGAGIVVLADWTPDFGNVIIISHGNGFVSYYAHAMRLLVDQGSLVRRGQSIALLGNSGISSAPHLHFEIWKYGEPLDPEKFIFALQQQQRTGEGM